MAIDYFDDQESINNLNNYKIEIPKLLGLNSNNESALLSTDIISDLVTDQQAIREYVENLSEGGPISGSPLSERVQQLESANSTNQTDILNLIDALSTLDAKVQQLGNSTGADQGDILNLIDSIDSLSNRVQQIETLANNNQTDILDLMNTFDTFLTQILPMNFTDTTVANVTTNAAALTGGSCRQVDIAVDFDYVGTIYVGSVGLTTSNGIPLRAGDACTFYVSNLNEIYVLGTVAQANALRIKYSGRR
jgi:hypothetical protein